MAARLNRESSASPSIRWSKAWQEGFMRTTCSNVTVAGNQWSKIQFRAMNLEIVVASVIWLQLGEGDN